jgi:hypothetical protein
MVVDGGPGGLPLGLADEPVATRRLPDRARIAVVTAGYAAAHYDDYACAVEEALGAASIELATARLLFTPSRPAAAGTLAGPALVIDPLEIEGDPRSRH